MGVAVAAAAASHKNKGTKAIKAIAHRVLPSGMAYDVLKPGRGAMADRARYVHIRYEGRLVNSDKVFDEGDITFRLGLGEVIRGWDEGIQGMLCGEVRRLYV